MKTCKVGLTEDAGSTQEIQRFQCPEYSCKKSYSYVHNLNKHIRSQHAPDPNLSQNNGDDQLSSIGEN